MAKIEMVDRLREIYRQPKELAAKKVMTEFEEHSRRFIELSPFLVISTTGSDGIGDVSPRGDAPGFVKVMDDKRTIAIPDRRGNNRIDTLTNIVTNPSVALRVGRPLGRLDDVQVSARRWFLSTWARG